MTIISVLVAGALAFSAWLIQRALNRAEEQRRVASRLRAYIRYWERRALATDIWQVLDIGGQWYDEYQRTITDPDSRKELGQKLLAIETKYQGEFADKLRPELDKTENAEQFGPQFKSAIARIQHARADVIGHLFQLRKELIEARTLVSDEDVAVFDVATVARVVELRMTLAGLIEAMVSLFQSIEISDASMVLPSTKTQIVEAALAGIRVGFVFKYLLARCESYLRRSKFRAMEANLFW